jgi:hypothetical protein
MLARQYRRRSETRNLRRSWREELARPYRRRKGT